MLVEIVSNCEILISWWLMNCLHHLTVPTPKVKDSSKPAIYLTKETRFHEIREGGHGFELQLRSGVIGEEDTAG